MWSAALTFWPPRGVLSETWSPWRRCPRSPGRTLAWRGRGRGRGGARRARWAARRSSCGRWGRSATRRGRGTAAAASPGAARARSSVWTHGFTIKLQGMKISSWFSDASNWLLEEFWVSVSMIVKARCSCWCWAWSHTPRTPACRWASGCSAARRTATRGGRARPSTGPRDNILIIIIIIIIIIITSSDGDRDTGGVSVGVAAAARDSRRELGSILSDCPVTVADVECCNLEISLQTPGRHHNGEQMRLVSASASIKRI